MATNMHEAMLYWDDILDVLVEDTNTWTLWFRDDAGEEHVEHIGESSDASLETLAYQVADCVPDGASGKIEVAHNARRRGTIDMHDGVVTGWRAA
jgi:hypothetical protein